MSIIHANESGWLLNHEDSINKDHEAGTGSLCKAGLFEIVHPFMMDSQFEKLQMQTSQSDAPLKTKGKKRKAEMNIGEAAFLESYEKIKMLLLKALEQLVDIGQRNGYFDPQKPKYEDNNTVARKAAADAERYGDPMRELVSMATNAGNDDVQEPIHIRGNEKCSNVINKMVHNPSTECIEVTVLGSTYILPPNSSFLLSDFSYMEPLVKGGKKFDLIVMDPPWQNKSVKRKKMYNTLRTEELVDLPINDLVKDGTVVVVWVTNRVQHQQIVTEKLFPAWKICQVSKWYWLKVTKSGIPIYDVESSHRKPYETLLIGRVKFPNEEESGKHRKEIPSDKVLVSIPCSIHSRKPPLSEVLLEYLPNEPSCLELFARNLRPNWTSWGNQVLSFQHQDFFQ